MAAIAALVKRAGNVKGIRGGAYRLGRGATNFSFALSQIGGILNVRLRPNRIPVVTMVVAGRNDDYMPDFPERLRATVAWNARYLANEVIFVEWNPPGDRDLLGPVLAREYPFVRAYVVDPAVHSEICANPHLPLLEFHAKNVGIRRAAGEWVLTTNADAAVSPGLVSRLGRSPWQPNVVWTAERYDIPWREGRRTEMRFADCLRYRRRIPYVDLGTGEFDLASRDLWFRAGGFDESLVRHRIGVDIRGVAQLAHFGGVTRRAGIVFHMSHPSSCVEGVRDHHGEPAGVEGIPYDNGPSWGLADRAEIEIAERVWRIS